ncbi:hypothetical protein QE152_g24998 [Popillia japonica]|uniref:Uncharacterized protein n=1 Tax=Popillia japonica TaxID=7064 RepID=A0AAW1K206_POPJA
MLALFTQQTDVQNWLAADDEGYHNINDEEILEHATTSRAVEQESCNEDESDREEILPKHMHSAALEALDTIRQYVEQPDSSTPMEIIWIKKWRDMRQPEKGPH